MKYVFTLVVAIITFMTLTAIASAQTPTLVQQLTANLEYAEEYFEYHPYAASYYGPRIARLQKQLAAAIAAEAVGKPLSPLVNEKGQITLKAPYGSSQEGLGTTSKAAKSGATKSGGRGGKKKGN